jgi:hypothetical protein
LEVKKLKPKHENEDHSVTLKVHKSGISSIDSGVARIHSSYMDVFDQDELEMIEIRAGKKHKVVKLVSDRLAKKNYVILREGDMEDLEIEDGDEVELHPYQTFSEDLKEGWQKFKEKFRRHKDEDDEEEEK